MKTRHILVLLALLAMICAISCQKSRYCFCVTDRPVSVDSIFDTQTNSFIYDSIRDTSIVNIDRSMKCKVFTQMGRESVVNGQTVRNYYTYTCTQIDKDTVPTIPNLPHVD